jgi:hypothetical protein
MKPALRWGARARVALASALAASALLLVLSGCGQRTRVAITIRDKHEHVPAATTFAEAVALFRLRPAAGSLLDVQGRVLRRRVFPVALLLDGRRAAGATRLRSGNRVESVAGHDRTEPLRHQLVPVRGGSLGDPQFLLSRTPGVEVIVRGAFSHELVSVRFRPNGHQPTVERAVALTFDDGPSPNDTPRILAVLRRLHVRATFFVIGYLAERYPQVVALERREGMAIGNFRDDSRVAGDGEGHPATGPPPGRNSGSLASGAQTRLLSSEGRLRGSGLSSSSGGGSRFPPNRDSTLLTRA